MQLLCIQVTNEYMKAKKATTIASKVKQAEMVAQENQNKPKAAKKNTKISTSCLYDIKAD